VKIRQDRKRQKGISLVVTIAGLVWVIIPMLGLVIDLGIVYSAKAGLQAAVDGAALAAARALSIGASTSAQATSAQQNATNWFYANFPNGNWNTSNTNLTVTVANSTSNAYLRQVTITATTNVPAWFMQLLGFLNTTLTVQGQASRKDVATMLVLDRSGSMCSKNGVLGAQPCGKGSGTACDDMITAAKIFTGSFAAGRDEIGMVTFSDGTYLDLAPTTDFQSKLGYTNDSGSGTGYIDNIQCGGGTGTAEAISIAYDQLYQLGEAGAMNIIMLETDGLPNTLVYNWWDGSSFGIANGSGCVDNNDKTVGGGGWKNAGAIPQSGWDSPGYTMHYTSTVSTGAIGAFYTNDPAQGNGFITLFSPWQISSSNKNGNSIAESGTNFGNDNCKFDGGTTSKYSDFAWLPSQDVFGNQINPATNPYQSVTLTNNHLVLTGTANTDWPHSHNAVLNATDNVAYNVRSNATLPAYVFVIGLGGNAGDPPDPVLLQRMANDPNGDLYNNPPVFASCASETTAGSVCVNYPSQPQGLLIYSPTAAELGQAFLAISSQILRLSQ
jgi:Flp pilus assembly protein TadG